MAKVAVTRARARGRHAQASWHIARGQFIVVFDFDHDAGNTQQTIHTLENGGGTPRFLGGEASQCSL